MITFYLNRFYYIFLSITIIINNIQSIIIKITVIFISSTSKQKKSVPKNILPQSIQHNYLASALADDNRDNLSLRERTRGDTSRARVFLIVRKIARAICVWRRFVLVAVAEYLYLQQLWRVSIPLSWK